MAFLGIRSSSTRRTRTTQTTRTMQKMSKTSTRLLHQLNRRSERMQETYHGQVHGQVLWEATYKARYSEEFNPSIYVCARMRHCYDTPENQLLKYLIERVEDCLKAVPPEIAPGWCFLPRTGERLTERISARLENL